MINDETSDGYTNQGVVDSTTLSPLTPPTTEDDAKFADLKHGLLPSCRGPAVDDASLNLECGPETSSYSAPSSIDGTLRDDSIFSEFIRSPSSNRLSASTVNHDDNLIDSTVNDTNNCKFSTPNDRTTTYEPLQGDETLSKKTGLRLRLRVGLPKPRITLRVSEPATKGRDKGRHKQVRRRAVRV